MGRRNLQATGINPDIFGHDKSHKSNKSRKHQRGDVSPPGVTPEVADKISQSLGFVPPLPPSQNHPLEPDSQDDENWEDIPEEMDDSQGINNHKFCAVDSSGNQYAWYQRELRRAEARAKRAKKWLAHENKIIAMYLSLQNRTLNWTTQHSYVNNEIECLCPSKDCQQRPVDLIDLLSKSFFRFLYLFSIHNVKYRFFFVLARDRHHLVTFCNCVPDVIRLLQLEYIAGSPQHPRTGFSI